MAWEVGFRHCSNENYEKRFGIKIDKKPHDPSSTQELICGFCIVVMLSLTLELECTPPVLQLQVDKT
eukprot:g19672.t1